ncbi:Hypothetical protein PP7435_CHR3-1248 [Komagataella phaffii CBS 7435]|uniref:Uncharacterized protein n=2 Tax=Komagataella phaffii TaxID=460519 RepID=C4R397_KOMPG|nr:Hypothetical protein PAS_c131_0019 [Komagataella phaffii GS115]AOA63478.1 GQ67_04302T0 [Komagataella phaffii]CAH2448921.1 Hypothetical protein BQ9382_C3-0010 [Komagataella phaffii CBS 7435]AOA69215.1 GQ68_04273T0 [Komagataella phaffii GS115]CAY71231.1 Hypothetical protein PAS_c131_0019 [Komagataella phaffii GS115]SCV12133.1 Hypothetical protein PP7435_CHR3-1248 [Komagataella phaffii CBS 7435]
MIFCVLYVLKNLLGSYPIITLTTIWFLYCCGWGFSDQNVPVYASINRYSYQALGFLPKRIHKVFLQSSESQQPGLKNPDLTKKFPFYSTSSGSNSYNLRFCWNLPICMQSVLRQQGVWLALSNLILNLYCGIKESLKFINNQKVDDYKFWPGCWLVRLLHTLQQVNTTSFYCKYKGVEETVGPKNKSEQCIRTK